MYNIIYSNQIKQMFSSVIQKLIHTIKLIELSCKLYYFVLLYMLVYYNYHTFGAI